MPLPGRAKQPRDHELAQRLDLAARTQGLSTNDLATVLSCSPRTVRRYLNGERRPQRATVVRWEEACRVEAGALTALYDRPDGGPVDTTEPHTTMTGAAEPDPHLLHTARQENSGAPSGRSPARRSPVFKAAAGAVMLVCLGVSVLLGLSWGLDGSTAGRAPSASASASVGLHRFPPAHVGDVWVQITPAREHVGADYHVTLRWGPIMQQALLRRLGPGPRSLLFLKTKPDDIVLRVAVQPQATIAFGVNRPPDRQALDVNKGWTRAH